MTAYSNAGSLPLRRQIVVGGAGAAARGRPDARPRRRVASPSRAGRRVHPAGRLIAAVLLLFLVGLIYLSQTVQLAGVGYEHDRLVAQRDDLARQAQTLETSLLRWRAEPMVVERAQQLGFETLIGKVRLAGR